MLWPSFPSFCSGLKEEEEEKELFVAVSFFSKQSENHLSLDCFRVAAIDNHFLTRKHCPFLSEMVDMFPPRFYFLTQLTKKFFIKINLANFQKLGSVWDFQYIKQKSK